MPQGNLDVKTKWLPCTPESLAEFSAVAYLFGRRLPGISECRSA